MKYNIDNIIPVEDQILVQLDKPHKVTVIRQEKKEEAVQREKDFIKERDRKWKEDSNFDLTSPENTFVYEEDDFYEVKEKVDAKFRTGIILRIPEYDDNYRGIKYEMGQRVIFENGHQIPLDLLTNKVDNEKCPVLLRGLHIRGIIN